MTVANSIGFTSSRPACTIQSVARARRRTGAARVVTRAGPNPKPGQRKAMAV